MILAITILFRIIKLFKEIKSKIKKTDFKKKHFNKWINKMIFLKNHLLIKKDS
jgi:hypothetical protein